MTVKETTISDAEHMLKDALVCDMCLPWGPGYENKAATLPRFKKAGVDYVSLTVGMDRLGLAATVKNIAAEKARIDASGGELVLAKSVEDIREARVRGKLALGFHFQGSESLEGDPNLVALFYDLGVRHMLLAYNQKNRAADGCHERTDCGLSRYGVKLVQEMNRVGMILDLSHTGYRSTMDAMEVCQGPCIFSHANAKGVKDHPRNIRDDQAKACAATGGVIGVNGIGFFLGDDNRASVENFAHHIDYYSELIGPRHVALGLDFVYFHDQMFAMYQANPDRFPKATPRAKRTGSTSRPSSWPDWWMNCLKEIIRTATSRESWGGTSSGLRKRYGNDTAGQNLFKTHWLLRS